MNDFAREVVEAILGYHAALGHMQECQQDDKRLDRFRKFIRSRRRNKRNPKVATKLSFEVSRKPSFIIFMGAGHNRSFACETDVVLSLIHGF